MDLERPHSSAPPFSRRLVELAALFLRLGVTAFGGPAAHIAMMHDEVVTRRKWLDEGHFLDLIGATNLIPGPNSTEMAIHVGFVRAGWRGLIVSGVCFILPAMLMVMGLAWAYVRFGSAPQAEGLLYGIKPVVIAVIAQALWNLGQKAVKNWPLALLGVAILPLYFLGVHELALLLGGGVAAMMVANLRRMDGRGMGGFLLSAFSSSSLLTSSALAAAPFSLSALLLTLLKIGSILYGSGYVLLAFLRADLVVRLSWLTDSQLIDAVAIGQVTPGPVFTTATFIGFFLGGIPGALLGTLGIFLPSFLFVALSNPLIPRLRESPWVSGLLDGVNVASLGLMAAVTWQLGRASIVDLPSALVALASLGLLTRFKVNSTWLVLGGAAIGVLRTVIQ